MSRVIGRVIKVHIFGKNLTFLSLASQGDIIEFVYEKPKCKIHFGDFLIIEYEKRYNANRQKDEYRVLNILDIIKSNNIDHSKFLRNNFNINSYEKLSLRMLVESEMHSFFKNKEYPILSSPSLVSGWVSGGTGNFELDFYKKNKAHLTISTMLHSYIAMSLGYDKIYEIATLFRKENPSSDKRLAEFTNVVVNQMGVNIIEIMYVFEEMLKFIYEKIISIQYKTLKIPSNIKFEKIEFKDVLIGAKISSIKGHQMDQNIKKYLNKNFNSFVWITNFPKNTRPFYCKSNKGICNDCQLWYRGQNFIAAGSEVEIKLDILKEKIEKEGKKIDDYLPFLEIISMGIFNLSGMDLGIERFLAVFIGGKSADYTFFPVYKNNILF